jgi:hypothetical protein
MPVNPDIALTRQRVLDGMSSYMKDDDNQPNPDALYTQADVERCGAIIDAYIAALGALPQPATPEAILEATEQTVIALNELNEACNHSLIETDQREDLCHIIILAARDAGMEGDDDITEEWRDW